MPADMVEIEEAEEEGVIFKNPDQPDRSSCKDEDGHVEEVILQVMELGEPDASGRRKPDSGRGQDRNIWTIDTMILAIGQAVDADRIFDCEQDQKERASFTIRKPS